MVLVEAGDRILGTFPRGLQRSAREKLERLGVELRLGVPVTALNAERVDLADGSSLAAHTISARWRWSGAGRQSLRAMGCG